MKYGIVNDVDRPCEELIVKVVKNGKEEVCNYIAAKHKEHPTMIVKRGTATPLSRFGVRVILGNGKYRVEKIGESTAKYPDGTTRNWQGDGIEVNYV